MFRDFLGFFRSDSKESKASDADLDRICLKVPEIKDDQPKNPYNEIQILAGHSDRVHLVVKIDENRALTASHDNTAAIWNLLTGNLMLKLQGHTKPINCVMMLSYNAAVDSKDEFEDDMIKALLTASYDKTIRLWSLSDGTCLKIINDHNHAIKCFIQLKDDYDDAVYCAGGDQLSLWDQNMKLLHVCKRKSTNYIKLMLSIKDQKIIAATDKSNLVVYTVSKSDGDIELQFSRKLPPHREPITCLINVSDAMFASASQDGTIMVWTTYHLTPTRQFNFNETYKDEIKNAFMFNVNHMFSLEQRYIVAAIANGFYIFDTISDRCLVKQSNAHNEEINHMALVNDGSYLATCCVEGIVRLWGAPTPISSDDVTERSRATTPLERLVGRRMKNVKQDSSYLELIGECAGHSDSIQLILPCGPAGFISVGSDEMVIFWRDGGLQSERRNKNIREIIQQTGHFSL